MNTKFILSVFLTFLIATSIAQTPIAICPQNATFSSMTRGYYFTAPCDFLICGLYVPTDASAGNQSVAIVRFTAGPPPTFGGTTNSFVSLFYQPNYAINAMIPCNVQVNTGDIIGIYGSRGAAVNSYGMANCATTIYGNPVTLYRSGMQYDLAVTPMQEIWYEDYNIGRVFMYIDCCPTADFTVTSPICLGDIATATYTGSGTPPTASFSWTFTGGVPATANTIGPHNISYATPGNKTVSLEVSQAGCTTVTSTQTIVVDPNPVVTINPSSASVCAGQSVTITANGANSYNWSGGLGTNASQNVSPGTTTTYTVTGTTGSCTGSASVTVTVNPNLTININPSAPQICAGQSVSITASGGTTYNWSGGLGAGATQNVSPSTTTTYTVTGSDAFGCTGTASVTVTVNPNPTVTINPSAPLICAGQSVTILAGGANTYNWSGGLGTNASQNVSPATTTTYTVTGTSTAGCTGTASATVTVNPDPTITATANPSGVCLGNSTTLSATGGNTYLWDSGNTNASWDVTPTVTTTYYVTGTDVNGCTGTAQVQVDVFDNLTVTVTPANPEICEGDNTNLTASSNGNNPTFSWSSGQNTATINVSPATTSTYTVTATDITGCSGTAQVTVIVNPLPYVHFEAIPLSGCVPVTVSFQNMSDAGTYAWNFGDGNTSTNQNPTNQYSNSGNYSVTLTVTANGCTNSLTESNYIQVYPMPVAGFMPSSNVVEQGQATVLFTDLSLGASSWLWDFGTGVYSTDQNPEYTYSDEGEFTVWQYVENQWGCRDSTYKTITVKPSVTFYIPNAFSPNGDGINDFFHPFGNNTDTDNYQMIIYDRWGKQIFRTDNINTPWDGTSPDSGGKIVPTGVYVYKISVTLGGLQQVFEGVVTLVF